LISNLPRDIGGRQSNSEKIFFFVFFLLTISSWHPASSIKLPAIVFRQSFPLGAINMASVNNDSSVYGVREVVTSFPSFVVEEPRRKFDVNYLNYHGYDMTMTATWHWKADGGYQGSTIGILLFLWFVGWVLIPCLKCDIINKGGAPLVLYNRKLKAMAISPIQNFEVGIQTLSPHLDNQLACGLNGKMMHVPFGFTHKTTIMVAGDGISNTMSLWGSQLLLYYGKNRTSPDINLTQRYLGYVTGNGEYLYLLHFWLPHLLVTITTTTTTTTKTLGAYYYYHLADGTKNYAKTMIKIKSSFEKQNIPVKWYEFDSWWYYRNSSEDGYTGRGGGYSYGNHTRCFPTWLWLPRLALAFINFVWLCPFRWRLNKYS